MNETIKFSTIFNSEKNKIVNVEMKNAKLPSNDLLNNFVFPNNIPNTAAHESDILIINNPKKAISLLKNKTVSKLPIKTKDAPVIFFFSISLVKILKNLS